MSKVIGIDISKLSFDTSFISTLGKVVWKKYSNDRKGFKAFVKDCGVEIHCIMEASGPYHLKLSYFLFNEGCKVSVVNPLVIKRYTQMLLSKSKTDKKDAELICRYGQSQQPDLWKPKEEAIMKMQQIRSTISGLEKKLRMTKNQRTSNESLPVLEKEVTKALNAVARVLENQIAQLEIKLEELVKSTYNTSYKRLQTIPGVGAKLAAELIVSTNNFKNFDSSKKLISYIGFSPRVYQSGTSVQGKGRISTIGKSRIRGILYMCSLSSIVHNEHCKKFYLRLTENGKNGKLAVIAVANKILRIAFGLMKNELDYDKNYQEKACF